MNLVKSVVFDDIRTHFQQKGAGKSRFAKLRHTRSLATQFLFLPSSNLKINVYFTEFNLILIYLFNNTFES